jgi:hypothetical protein
MLEEQTENLRPSACAFKMLFPLSKTNYPESLQSSVGRQESCHVASHVRTVLAQDLPQAEMQPLPL